MPMFGAVVQYSPANPVARNGGSRMMWRRTVHLTDFPLAVVSLTQQCHPIRRSHHARGTFGCLETLSEQPRHLARDRYRCTIPLPRVGGGPVGVRLEESVQLGATAEHRVLRGHDHDVLAREKETGNSHDVTTGEGTTELLEYPDDLFATGLHDSQVSPSEPEPGTVPSTALEAEMPSDL